LPFGSWPRVLLHIDEGPSFGTAYDLRNKLKQEVVTQSVEMGKGFCGGWGFEVRGILVFYLNLR